MYKIISLIIILMSFSNIFFQQYTKEDTVQFNLAFEYYNNENSEKAFEILSELVDQNTNYPPVYYYMGIINQVKGNYDEAKKYYLITIEKDSSFSHAYSNLGSIIDDNGQSLNYLNKILLQDDLSRMQMMKKNKLAQKLQYGLKKTRKHPPIIPF